MVIYEIFVLLGIMHVKHQTQLSLLQDDIRSRYDSLSKRLKQVAQYILDNSNSVAFDTVASIAQHADVPLRH